MHICFFRFYEELGDFLPIEKRKREISYSYWGRPSVKDAIEAIGVPHTEVDLILVTKQGNKESRAENFSYKLNPGDRISVYPVFESLDITDVSKVRTTPIRRSAFILDVHLGKLARYLRLAGFDSLYENNLEDEKIISIAKQENRIILTRDVGILKNSRVTHGYYVRSIYPREQLIEVKNRFSLRLVPGFKGSKEFPSRCSICNGRIDKIFLDKSSDKESIRLLGAELLNQYSQFYRCTSCLKLYWQGSHYQRILSFMQDVFKDDSGDKRY